MIRYTNFYSPSRTKSGWEKNTINELKWLRWLLKNCKK